MSTELLRRTVRLLVAATLLAGAVASLAAEPANNSVSGNMRASDQSTNATLQPVKAFSGIADRKKRSLALFTEAAKVLQHPRCLNCHPADRTPTQGQDMHAHVPAIRAGADGHGPLGLDCNTCHQAENLATNVESVASIPGHMHWSLAPASMSWQKKSTAEICQQLKDPARNGGRDLAKIHKHLASDTLVGWAWRPGPGREPAPGTQDELGKLILGWIETGAVCP